MSCEVVVYVSQGCSYCDKAMALLNKKKAKYKVIDVTYNTDLRVEAMEKSGGRKTVPQILINDKSIGGFDDLSALDRRGELDALLELS